MDQTPIIPCLESMPAWSSKDEIKNIVMHSAPSNAQQQVAPIGPVAAVFTPRPVNFLSSEFFEVENRDAIMNLRMLQVCGQLVLRGMVDHANCLLAAMLHNRSLVNQQNQHGFKVAIAKTGASLPSHRLSPSAQISDKDKEQLMFASCLKGDYLLTCQSVACIAEVYPQAPIGSSFQPTFDGAHKSIPMHARRNCDPIPQDDHRCLLCTILCLHFNLIARGGLEASWLWVDIRPIRGRWSSRAT